MAVYKIMSMNILTDKLFSYGHSPFNDRIKAINELVRIADPDVIGIQEVTDTMKPLMIDLFRKYRMVGISRGSVFADEYSALLVKADTFEVRDSGTLWLSETPEIRRSKVAFSQFPRITSYAVLYDIYTDQAFTVFCTHLDVNFPAVRRKHAEILAGIVQKYAQGDFCAVTGDFNTCRGTGVLEKLTDAGLTDLVTDDFGPTLRIKLGKKTRTDLPIDHILVSPGVKLISLIKMDQQYAGFYPSDHYPIMATISYE